MIPCFYGGLFQGLRARAALSSFIFGRPKTNPWANDASQRLIDDNRSNERTASADGREGWSSLYRVPLHLKHKHKMRNPVFGGIESSWRFSICGGPGKWRRCRHINSLRTGIAHSLILFDWPRVVIPFQTELLVWWIATQVIIVHCLSMQ